MKTKRCSRADHKGSAVLPLSEFPTNKRKPDGHQTYCKACARRYDKVWRVQDRKKHPEKYQHYQRAYEEQRFLATPPWVEKLQILALYEQARTLTKETGIKYQVDHVVPLKGKHISGLHCLSNLQIITKDKNLKKSNKF